MALRTSRIAIPLNSIGIEGDNEKVDQTRMLRILADRLNEASVKLLLLREEETEHP